MPRFERIEPAYLSPGGCRMVWGGADEDDKAVVLLNEGELRDLVEIIKRDAAGKVKLEDQVSEILVNSDVVQFRLQDGTLEAGFAELQRQVLDYTKVPHEPRRVSVRTKEFYPSARARGDPRRQRQNQQQPRRRGGAGGGGGGGGGEDASKSLLRAILSGDRGGSGEISQSDLFRVLATRRTTRKFDRRKKVEDWKVEKILAAADTAPTAGNFQGFEVFYVRSGALKEALVEAANRQPYVNAPVVLVFCTNPSRVKMQFPEDILAKFSLQDATLAAAYSQLAASAVGLSSVWIGMIDEEKVKGVLGTDLRPSSILCVGYPSARRRPKSRRHLKDLIHVLE